jgi:hypothetical protein
MGSAAFAEVEAEPDWNEAGLRLQDYMEEYADCPETLAMLENFLELYVDELVGYNPDIRSQEEIDELTGANAVQAIELVPMELPPTPFGFAPFSLALNSNRVFRCGDVDGSGSITMDDASEIQRHLTNSSTNTIDRHAESLRAAMICRHTGAPTTGDHLAIQRAIQGLSSALDTCKADPDASRGRSCSTPSDSNVATSVVWFDGQGGTRPSSRVAVRNNRLSSVISTIPTSTRDRHTFWGWFTETGAQATGATIVDDNMTIMANWRAISHPTLNDPPELRGTFTTADIAATTWANYVYSTSFFIYHEHGATIYRNSAGRFFLSSTVTGRPHSVMPFVTPPAGATAVATIHTHPGGSSDFSGGDLENAKKGTRDKYVVVRNPSSSTTYRVRKYTASTGLVSALNTPITLRPLSQATQTALISFYQNSWNHHFPCDSGNCLRNPSWPRQL